MEPDAFDRIAPAPVDLGNRATRAPARHPMARRQWLPLAGIGILALIAIGVIFVLPGLRPAPVPPPTSATPGTADPAPDTVGPAGGEASAPARAGEDEARLAARGEAQDLLEVARDKQAALAAIGVSTWSAARFREGTEALASGERAYSALDYATARDRFRAADAVFTALQEAAPAVFAEAMTRGNAALDQGNAGAARDAFRLAQTIRPDDPAARKGAARAETLDRVLALVQEGEALARTGNAAGAAEKYQQALALDPDHRAATERLSAVRARLADAAFRAAMSAGFTALEANDPLRARRHFQEALRLKPGAPEAQDALRLADNQATATAIEEALAAARAAASAEHWDVAVAQFQAALKQDGNLLEARNGLDVARQRLELDGNLAGAIARPERLSDDAVQQEAGALLTRAGAINNPGPRLKQQMAVLSALLTEARTPVAVNLVSDGETDVNLYRVGRQGKFAGKSVALRPGKYVAVGTRPGYRDVRVEFTVDARAPAPTVTVQCNEPVQGAR